MTEKIRIPVGVILEMDDVGWDDGRDLRTLGRASRSGLPRNHAVEDFEFISDLAKRTGKNIVTALCVGDWDKDNLLRGRVGYTHDPYGWNRAREIDLKKTARMIEILEGEGIEYALHGVLHGLYEEDGSLNNEKEYFRKKTDENGQTVYYLESEDFLRERLETFFEIIRAWDIKKEIRSFVNPCGVHRVEPESIERMSSVLKEYGIRYWADPIFGRDGKAVTLKDGIARIHWGVNKTDMPWEAYDIDPDTLFPTNADDKKTLCCWQGSHLTNFLRFNPKKNKDGLEGWERFYKMQESTFGQMNAKSLDEAVNQLLYAEYATVTEKDGKYEIDLTRVKKTAPEWHRNRFFVSIRDGLVPRGISGGKITLYEKQEGFSTYLIEEARDTVVIG